MHPHDFNLTAAEVAAARTGDTEALDSLFARYLPRVTRMVGARIGRSWRELALDDDLVQEALVDAFVAIRDGSLHTDGAFCAWLARVVEHRILGARRHGKAAKRGAGKVERFADLAESYLSDSMLADDDATPSQHAAARETEERLEAALLAIDPRYREVICLRAYCRMPYSEIASSMGLPSENTANVLFLRARKELRRRLED